MPSRLIPLDAPSVTPARRGRPRTGRSRAQAAAIPTFALYGEQVANPPELLHVETVRSRSGLYDWEIGAHLHQGLFQVVWVREGWAEVVLDERRARVAAPAAIMLPPGVVHGFQFAPGTDGTVLTLSARFLADGEFQAVGEAFRALFSAPGVLHFAPDDPQVERLAGLLTQLLAEFGAPDAAQSPVAGWLARSVVWRLAQARLRQRPEESLAGRHQALFTRFLLLVEEHFLAHWSLAQYASRLGLSTARLNRIVRAEAGCSALELVHERLTREACRRLAFIEAPAATLAAELGFADPAYFSRFFKRRTGMTPQKWRQARRGA